MLLGRHDEVVRVVFVIHNVFKVNARHLVQLFKEFLIEYECHAADLRHLLRIAHVSPNWSDLQKHHVHHPLIFGYPNKASFNL